MQINWCRGIHTYIYERQRQMIRYNAFGVKLSVYLMMFYLLYALFYYHVSHSDLFGNPVITGTALGTATIDLSCSNSLRF